MLEELFPRVPGNVTVVLHDSPVQLLAVASRYLPVARRLASPPARRYMAGWFAAGEVHALSPPALRALPPGPDSARGADAHPAARLHAARGRHEQPAAAAALPARAAVARCCAARGSPRERPSTSRARSVPARRRSRCACARGRRRLPAGPARRRAAGGALFDLLDRERGERACVRLATHPATDPARRSSAFGRPLPEIAAAWREHLDRLATPAPDVSAVA